MTLQKYVWLILFAVFCISYANASAVIIDDFEDGDHTDDPPWTVNSGTWVVDTNIVKVNVYSLSAIGGSIKTTSLNYIDNNFDMNVWIYLDTISGGVDIIAFNDTSNKQVAYVGAINVGTIHWLAGIGGSTASYPDAGTHCNPEPDKWYKIRINHDKNENTVLYEFYNSTDGNLSCYKVGAEYIATDIANTITAYGSGGATVAHFDYITQEVGDQGIVASFDYNVNKYLTSVDLNDTSTPSLETITINDWDWNVNGAKVSDDQNYNYSTTQLQDLNVCLTIQDDTNTYTAQTCSFFNTGDWEAPSTTLTVQNIGLLDTRGLNFTCTDNNIGCNTITWDLNAEPVTSDITSGSLDVNVSGIGEHTVTFYSIDLNNNVEAQNSEDFNIFGGLVVRVKDENSEAMVDAASVTLNGNTFLTNASGELLVDLNYLPVTTTTYDITINKTNYGTRNFEIDLNNESSVDLNALLYPSSLGTSIQFRFYAPDDTTLLNNALVEVYRPDIDWNWLVSSNSTNANGYVTFFLDSNAEPYAFKIEGGYDYNAVALTISEPINEYTGVVIGTNWFTRLTSIGFQDINNISGNQVVYVFGNTAGTYNVSVGDVADTYYDVSYNVRYIGDDATDSLQPYLTPINIGAEITIVTLDSIILLPVGDVLIEVWNIVGGSEVLVESKYTDDSGRATVTLVTGNDYSIRVYQNGTLVDTKTINVSGDTTLYFFFRTGESWDTTRPPVVDVLFFPAYSTLYSWDDTLTQNATIQNGAIQEIRVRVINLDQNDSLNNDVTVYDSVFSVGVSAGYVNDVNLLAIDYNGGSLRVDVWVLYLDKNFHDFVIYKTYSTGFSSLGFLQNDIKGYFGCSVTQGINWDTPCPTLVLISIFISILSTMIVIPVIGLRENFLTAIFLFVAGVFTFLSWIPVAIYIFLFAIGVFIIFVGRNL